MGGYGAFRFARATNATYVTAISPQFSIHPDVVPFDKRYGADAAGFERDLSDLTRVPRPDLQGIIITDPFRPLDLVHANMITEAFARVRIARLPFGGHPATSLIARASNPGVIQRTALKSPPTAAPIIAAHRAARRGDAVYQKALAAKILAR